MVAVQRLIYGVKIEGFGISLLPAHPADRQYRWIWGREMLEGLAVRDPDNVYLDGLMRWPKELGASVDFLSGTVSTGTQEISLLGNEIIWSLLTRTLVPVNGTLQNGIDAVVPSIDLSETGLPVGTIIYLEREAIILGAEAPAFTYACARGILGTMPQSHGVDDNDDTEYFRSTMHPSTMSGRRVDLITIDIDSPVTPYGGESIVWTGILRSISLPSPEMVRLEIDNTISLVNGRSIMKGQWQGKLFNLLRNGERAIHFSFFGPDDPYPSAGYPADERFVLRLNEKGAAVGPYGQLGNQVYAGGSVDDAWQEIAGYSVPDIENHNLIGEAPAWELITSWNQQPASSAIPSDNTLPLSQEPAKAILQLLLTTEWGSNSATYDTGKQTIAGSIPANMVDVNAIEEWGRRNAGRVIDNLILGIDGKPESLLSVIQDRILHMFSSVLMPGRNGLLTVVQLSDSPEYGETLFEIDSQTLLGPPDHPLPVMERRLEMAVDNVVVKYRLLPNGKHYETIEGRDRLNRQRKGIAEYSSIEVDAGATTNRSAAFHAATGLVVTWHNPLPLVIIEVLRTVDLWPGELCKLTHPLIMGLDGTRGLDEVRCLVIGRTESLKDNGHFVRLDLLLVGAAYTSDPCWIAPSGIVDSFAANTPVPGFDQITLVTNGFSTVDSLIDTDAGGFFASDHIQVNDSEGATIVGGTNVTVSNVVGDVLTVLSGTLAMVPSPGDIIRVSDYDSVQTSQKSTWAFVSDANGTLGAAADTAKEYTNP